MTFFLPSASLDLKVAGSFSNDNGDGGENVAFKMNSRFFKLCCLYFNSLKMSNVGQCFRS